MPAAAVVGELGIAGGIAAVVGLKFPLLAVDDCWCWSCGVIGLASVMMGTALLAASKESTSLEMEKWRRPEFPRSRPARELSWDVRSGMMPEPSAVVGSGTRDADGSPWFIRTV